MHNRKVKVQALMITHDRHLGEIYAAALKEYGIELKVIARLSKALVLLQEKERAVIVDADMPGEHILESVQSLKNVMRDARNALVVIARRPTKKDIHAVTAMGASHFFVILYTRPATIAAALIKN